MSGTLNPANPAWAKQSTRKVERTGGVSIVEQWVGPKSTESVFLAGRVFGEQHPDELSARLSTIESEPDSSNALGRVTLTYDPAESGGNAGMPMAPVGTDYLSFHAEPYDVPPISPGQADFGGPQATTENRYVFTRTQVVSSFNWTITNIATYFVGEIGAGNGDAGARPAGVTGGADDNWSSVLESVRESDGAFEIITRHTYSPA